MMDVRWHFIEFTKPIRTLREIPPCQVVFQNLFLVSSSHNHSCWYFVHIEGKRPVFKKNYNGFSPETVVMK